MAIKVGDVLKYVKAKTPREKREVREEIKTRKKEPEEKPETDKGSPLFETRLAETKQEEKPTVTPETQVEETPQELGIPRPPVQETTDRGNILIPQSETVPYTYYASHVGDIETQRGITPKTTTPQRSVVEQAEDTSKERADVLISEFEQEEMTGINQYTQERFQYYINQGYTVHDAKKKALEDGQQYYQQRWTETGMQEKIKGVYSEEYSKVGYVLVAKPGGGYQLVRKEQVEREQRIETTTGVLKEHMVGTPEERLIGMGAWITTGILSWEDPLGFISTYQVMTGDIDGAIETKSKAITGLDEALEKGTFIETAIFSPVGQIGLLYGLSAGVGAGVGGFKATAIGSKTLVSIGVGAKAKPLIEITTGKLIELGIAGYGAYETGKALIPQFLEAQQTGDYSKFVGSAGYIATTIPFAVSGYRTGHAFGYGRMEAYLYKHATYKPGSPEFIKFEQALKLSRTLKDVRSHKMTPLDFAKNISRLDSKTAYEVMSFLRKHPGTTIGGSASSYTQIVGARTPRDIDLLVKGGAKKVLQAKRFFDTTKTAEGKHLIDIHGKEFYKPGKYYRFGFRMQDPVKIGEFKYFKAGEQLFRKGVASVVMEAKYRWFKDVPDFVTHARSLIGTLEQKPLTFLGKYKLITAKKSLDLFLHPETAPTYGKDISIFGKLITTIGGKPKTPDIVYVSPGVYEYGYPKAVYPSYVTGASIPSYIIPTDKTVGYDIGKPYTKTTVEIIKPSIAPPGKKPSKDIVYTPDKKISDIKTTPTIETAYPKTYPSKDVSMIPDITTDTTPYVKPVVDDTYLPPGKYDPGGYPSIPFEIPYKKKTFKMFPLGDTKKREYEKGYNVFVKDRVYKSGKKVYEERFIRANKTPLSEIDALSLGGHITDNSAAASFIIRPTKAKAQPLKHTVHGWGVIGHKFYRNKKGVYIERTTHRIDSAGELEGITAKGLLARMNMQRMDMVKEPAPVKKRKITRRKDIDMDIDLFDIDLFGSGDKDFDNNIMGVGLNTGSKRRRRLI